MDFLLLLLLLLLFVLLPMLLLVLLLLLLLLLLREQEISYKLSSRDRRKEATQGGPHSSREVSTQQQTETA